MHLQQEDIHALMKESKNMKQLNHPNAMELVGMCLNPGAHYIVLPYMAGTLVTLTNIIMYNHTLILN